jgi:PAS domain S-box-containing protein
MKAPSEEKAKPIRLSRKDSEIRYRRLFEAAQDGILFLDAKTGMIDDVNPFLINMLGYSREEFSNNKLWEVGAFKDIRASKDAFLALQKNEYIRYKDLPLRAKDGKLVPVEFVSNVYWAGDGNVIQCNIRDITERKQAQNAMLKTLCAPAGTIRPGPFSRPIQPSVHGRNPGPRAASSHAEKASHRHHYPGCG